ncbi:MAG: hypothetical protein GF398_05315 [Chitinivibrionales bacterium]|nr:hypothetical protein [Chitinivibrionales bacterium]
MHFFDIIVIAMACILAFFGAKRGLIGEIVRLIAVIAGVAAAFLFYKDVFIFIDFIKASESARLVIAFIVLFVAVVAAVFVVGWVVRKIIRLTPLGWVDHLVGALIGLAKTVLIIWIFVVSVNASPFSKLEHKLLGSYAYSLLSKIPFTLNAPRLTVDNKAFDGILDKSPLGKLDEAKKKMNEYRTKVDSVKGEFDQQKRR